MMRASFCIWKTARTLVKPVHRMPRWACLPHIKVSLWAWEEWMQRDFQMILCNFFLLCWFFSPSQLSQKFRALISFPRKCMLLSPNTCPLAGERTDADTKPEANCVLFCFSLYPHPTLIPSFKLGNLGRGNVGVSYFQFLVYSLLSVYSLPLHPQCQIRERRVHFLTPAHQLSSLGVFYALTLDNTILMIPIHGA